MENKEIGFIVDKNYLALSYLKGMWEMRWSFYSQLSRPQKNPKDKKIDNFSKFLVVKKISRKKLDFVSFIKNGLNRKYFIFIPIIISFCNVLTTNCLKFDNEIINKNIYNEIAKLPRIFLIKILGLFISVNF